MVDYFADTVRSYRDRARRIRQVAQSVPDDECQQVLSILADRYETAAQQLDAVSAPLRPGASQESSAR